MTNRRSFIKLSGLLGLSLASTCLIPASVEAVKFNRKMYKVSKTSLSMGTYVSMTLIHTSKDAAEEALANAFKEIDRLTQIMTRFDSSAAVAQLNKKGFLQDVPPEVYDIVAKSLNYYHISNGNFDISVKPVVDLLATALKGDKNSLSEKKLKEAMLLVGANGVELKGRAIRFKKHGMGITLDGIAKGYIVDKASDVLNKHQIKNHLINAGGDIKAQGTNANRGPWTIAIQDPQKKKQFPDIIRMTNGAIATSGNYEVYFDREKMFHHIVNPKTGISPTLDTSVSVVAKTTMDADALSTSVFVVNPSSGARFIESLPGRECLILDRSGKAFKSKGWGHATT
jgi:thiamine biosynthesis lipoprotein